MLIYYTASALIFFLFHVGKNNSHRNFLFFKFNVGTNNNHPNAMPREEVSYDMEMFPPGNMYKRVCW
jgi:hypothetical protein